MKETAGSRSREAAISPGDPAEEGSGTHAAEPFFVCTIEECAEALGLSVAQVRRIEQRALAKLRRLVRREDWM